jgi:hypothetical protein
MDLKSAWKSAFLIPFLLKFFFKGHMSTFFNFEAKRAKNGDKKTTLSKPFLDLNFAPFNGSLFLIFLKKDRCTLMASTRTCNSHEGPNFDLAFRDYFCKNSDTMPLGSY